MLTSIGFSSLVCRRFFFKASLAESLGLGRTRASLLSQLATSVGGGYDFVGLCLSNGVLKLGSEFGFDGGELVVSEE
ncbi:hypothetical protein QYF36_023313 [Acer negundo]|nr:hypothetical protein QYF36_023313 [Acer negundo]